jgi:hypothetical protein
MFFFFRELFNRSAKIKTLKTNGLEKTRSQKLFDHERKCSLLKKKNVLRVMNNVMQYKGVTQRSAISNLQSVHKK